MSLRLLLLTLLVGTFTARADETKTILFLGDSITAGYGLDDPSTQAYPALIQQKINAARLPWNTINAGVSGDTTASGLRRIDWLLRRNIDIIVLALGGNDGLRGIDPTVTQENLKGIIARARARQPGVRIILAGMQMPANMGNDYTTRFREIFPAVAITEHCELIPFLLEGIGADPQFNQPDLIHPTATGQQHVAETVWKSLLPLLSASLASRRHGNDP